MSISYVKKFLFAVIFYFSKGLVLGLTDAVGLGFKIIFYKGIILTLQQEDMSYIDAYINLRDHSADVHRRDGRNHVEGYCYGVL